MSPHPPSFFRRFWPPLLLGAAGLAVLPLQIAEMLATRGLPDSLAALPRATVVALSMANPAILLLVGCVLGAATAHRVGLGSWAAGTAPRPARSHWAQAAAAGLAVALALYLIDAAWMRALQAPIGTRHLLLGVLYGGLTEEVMMRWGWMSLFAWLAARVAARRHAVPPPWVFVIAMVLAALLFAAGHLPAVAATAPLTPESIARTLLLNAIAGVAYGWLYWRRGLECAMAAHAATHAGFWLLARL